MHWALYFVWGLGCSEEALKLLLLLVSRGSEWDPTCDKIARQTLSWPALMKSRLDVKRENKRWTKEALTVRLCVTTWMLEHRLSRPLTHVPIEHVRRSVDATTTYLREFSASTETIYRRKICVVGPSNWGKTTLVKSLTRDEPSLVHPDDRTIGIDHFKLAFKEPIAGEKTPRSHEVTFWDFAGQEAYQASHSLFFSGRTLFFVCIDLESYCIARMQAEIMTDLDSQADRFMNDFLDTKVLRWLRLIFARQPDAEFVFIATKKDRLQEHDLRDYDSIVEDLKKRLANVMVVVCGMRELRQCQDGNENENEAHDRSLITHLWDRRLATLETKPHVQIIISTCVTAAAVATMKADIKDVITTSDQGYPMPANYSLVLIAVLRMALDAARLGTDARLRKTFVDVNKLVKDLLRQVQNPRGTTKTTKPYLDVLTCQEILRALHDLGDLLWYEDIGDATLQHTVILDPLLMIDFVRQVITHKFSAEMMPHSKLKGLPFWVTLDEDGFLFMKQVLQHFYLVYPSIGGMEWDSDLIVPAYWKANTCAFWKFGGDILRLGPKPTDDDVAVRVHWEFHFPNEFPDVLFDNLVVASFASTFRRDVGPDWILYQCEELYACRVVLGRDFASVQRSLHLEAVLATTGSGEADNLWTVFQYLSSKLTIVLRNFPGLTVTSLARNRAGEEHRLRSVLVSPVSPDSLKWMPPGATWVDYEPLAKVNRR